MNRVPALMGDEKLSAIAQHPQTGFKLTIQAGTRWKSQLCDQPELNGSLGANLAV